MVYKSENSENNNQRTYKPQETAEKVGITTETLRKWAREFNIQTEKTENGHRRYTKENIEKLMGIKQKIHVQNWSWDQVKAWINGEEEQFVPHEEKSILESKMDKLTEMYEAQLQFNQRLVEELGAMKKDNHELKELVKNLPKELPPRETDERDLKLIESFRETMDEKAKEIQEVASAKEEEKKGIFERWFGFTKKNR
ncbi:MAG: MerR family transcriptional regulator [Bacillota bacterium]